MSFISPIAGEDFSVRVVSKLDGPVPLRWANTWEISGGTGVTTIELLDIMNALAEFHRLLTCSTYQIERAILSTLAADSQPYDPEALHVESIDSYGGRSVAASEPYALSECVLVRKNVAYGRLGHALLRGMLREGDVSGGAGIVRLRDVSEIQADINGAITASGLDAFLGDGTGSQSYVALVTPGTLNNIERPVLGMTAVRMTAKKLNNKYFDRA